MSCRGIIFEIYGSGTGAVPIKKYFYANIALLPDQIHMICGSSEPAIMHGMDIVMVSGDENNYKVTTAGDLQRFREIKEAQTL